MSGIHIPRGGHNAGCDDGWMTHDGNGWVTHDGDDGQVTHDSDDGQVTHDGDDGQMTRRVHLLTVSAIDGGATDGATRVVRATDGCLDG